MSFLAAVLLLNMEPSDAFICFANLLNKPCQLAFFRVDHPMVSVLRNSAVDFLAQFPNNIEFVNKCYFPHLPH